MTPIELAEKWRTGVPVSVKDGIYPIEHTATIAEIRHDIHTLADALIEAEKQLHAVRQITDREAHWKQFTDTDKPFKACHPR